MWGSGVGYNSCNLAFTYVRYWHVPLSYNLFHVGCRTELYLAMFYPRRRAPVCQERSVRRMGECLRTVRKECSGLDHALLSGSSGGSDSARHRGACVEVLKDEGHWSFAAGPGASKSC
ncbi:hypothetical protein VaNZ11_000401 [Volvox africanus]|uniref:Uncharacterized protein n=1 Tax=Volvox africanus TaxID=51714 RepID=A0ABQ5RM55_9CHLO|nr:hypothetical protein VaNZ11_000401 [Volvox africanus]